MSLNKNLQLMRVCSNRLFYAKKDLDNRKRTDDDNINSAIDTFVKDLSLMEERAEQLVNQIQQLQKREP